MALHKDLAGADLHEPKGIESASLGQVYVADGSDSGDWTTLPPAQITLTVVIPDISTAGSTFTVGPVSGVITAIYGVLGGPITVADANISFEINGVPITSSGINVPFTSSAAGDTFNSSPSALNVIAPNDTIEVITDGGSTDAQPFTVVLVVNVS